MQPASIFQESVTLGAPGGVRGPDNNHLMKSCGNLPLNPTSANKGNSSEKQPHLNEIHCYRTKGNISPPLPSLSTSAHNKKLFKISNRVSF